MEQLKSKHDILKNAANTDKERESLTREGDKLKEMLAACKDMKSKKHVEVHVARLCVPFWQFSMLLPWAERSVASDASPGRDGPMHLACVLR